MPKGIYNRNKKVAAKKKAPAKKVVKKAAPKKRVKATKLEDVVTAAREAGADVEVKIVDSVTAAGETQNQTNDQATSSNDWAFGNAIHQALADHLTGTKIEFGGKTAVGNKTASITIARNGVNRSVSALINATIAYNNCKATIDEPVLRAELDLANARYQRALEEFQAAITA